MKKISEKIFGGRRGQSLIEAIVAITILTLGFVGMFSLLAQSLHLGSDVVDQTKATYLAAEGIEITKNFIDHSVYLGIASPGYAYGGWNGGTACFSFVSGSQHYEMDYSSVNCNALVPSANPLNTPLMYNASSGLYGYNVGGVATPFMRDIMITRKPYEIDVKSTVSWSSGGTAGESISLEDHFYDWNPSSN
jgi:hypothetical protein